MAPLLRSVLLLLCTIAIALLLITVTVEAFQSNIRPKTCIPAHASNGLSSNLRNGETSYSLADSDEPKTETDADTELSNDLNTNVNRSSSGSQSFRKRVKRLTKKMVPWSSSSSSSQKMQLQQPSIDLQTKAIIDEAFAPAEESIRELEESLVMARAALANAKLQSYRAVAEAQGGTNGSANGSSSTFPDEKEATATAFSPPNNLIDDEPAIADGTIDEEFSYSYSDLESLAFEDVDFESSEMAPPFLDQDSCLMTDAEPLVRVEKAPDNSRRIFAGIDILASADDVWNVSLKVYM